MSIEQQVYDISLQANADYCTTSKQFYLMKINTSGRFVLAGAANAATIGPLQNRPKQYEAASVRQLGISKVVCGDDIACAAKVTGDSASKAVTASAGERYCGIALEAGTSGRVISILMEHGYMPAGD